MFYGPTAPRTFKQIEQDLIRWSRRGQRCSRSRGRGPSRARRWCCRSSRTRCSVRRSTAALASAASWWVAGSSIPPAAATTLSARRRRERASRSSACVFLAAFVAAAAGRRSVGGRSAIATVSLFPAVGFSAPLLLGRRAGCALGVNCDQAELRSSRNRPGQVTAHPNPLTASTPAKVPRVRPALRMAGVCWLEACRIRPGLNPRHGGMALR
jgi:hypothetical protein